MVPLNLIRFARWVCLLLVDPQWWVVLLVCPFKTTKTNQQVCQVSGFLFCANFMCQQKDGFAMASLEKTGRGWKSTPAPRCPLPRPWLGALSVLGHPVPDVLRLLVEWKVSVAQSRPFNLLVFHFWSIFSKGPKRLTFCFWVLWANEFPLNH